ncbi:ABC transporter permease [Leucobacter sp. CSA1]|uniref:ABC transporter permease n=1 Tax=Leucobacter chromiisoli TaxID=2796471 RepID=A0A934UWZ1_9MICO|nr:ABC transporter permease [Leucobacter chromiisoli]MBK0420407.1 ABC transporter permease [Leucobacter chromiisoli]
MANTSVLLQPYLGKKHLRFDWATWLSSGFLALVILAAVLAPWLVPLDPQSIDLARINAPAGSPGHLLGTDQNGRDILSRLIMGTRTSMIGPLLVVAISSVCGILIGAIAGWSRGSLDVIVSRVIDFLFAFPALLIAVFTVALFGKGILAPSIGIAIAYTPLVARLTRNLVMQERDRLYVQSLRVLGAGEFSTLMKHVLPVVFPTILSQCLLSFGYAMVDLAAISYLGLGVQAPAADWGLMVAEAQPGILSGAFGPILWPSLAIVLTVVSFNHVGERILEKRGGFA